MRILHVLDHGLPLQSGYTFRTRAILKAQEQRGWQVAAVTGPRQGGAGDAVESVDGLTFYRTRTPLRPGVIGELAGIAAFAAAEAQRPLVAANADYLRGLPERQVLSDNSFDVALDIRLGHVDSDTPAVDLPRWTGDVSIANR